jgi:hypothetical protein
MKLPGSARRRRAFLATIAQLALVAYLFQVAAIDHWHASPDMDIYGYEGTQTHIAHCHGDLSSCADTVSSPLVAGGEQIVVLPTPPIAHLTDSTSGQASAHDVFIPTPSDPPRAA